MHAYFVTSFNEIGPGTLLQIERESGRVVQAELIQKRRVHIVSIEVALLVNVVFWMEEVMMPI
jgi:hypothetical protein